MGPRFMNMSTFVSEQDDSENSPENSADSPRFAMLNDSKLACTSSPKKSRRSIQKRVISVPIKDLEGSRLKGEMGGAPPSDSWSWRKYGQKPIKGSPYPRGYYRCSSSKGCPARKQVERSMLDPTKLMVTYSCEHNHPWPAPRNHNHNVATRKTPIIIQTEPTNSGEEYEEQEQKPTINITQKSTELIINNISHDDQKIGNLGGEATTLTSEYGYTNNYWFSEFECTTSTTMFESPLMSEARVTDADMAMVFTMRDDDESFFADLGELPECSTVFRREIMEREEHHRQHNLAPWCGTT